MNLNISTQIKEASLRIAPFIRQTPLQYSHLISENLGCKTYLKLENYQVTGSFKARGALNKILKVTEENSDVHVVTASTGNHAAAVGYALRQVNMPGTIFLPENVSDTKVKSLSEYDVELKYIGNDSVDAERAARDFALGNNYLYVSPYNDLDIIAGQGTIGLEILNEIEPDTVFVPIGGGGLVSGIASYISFNSEADITGCQPENSAVMHKSIEAGKLLDLPSLPTISDGTAGGVEHDSITFPFCQELIKSWVDVSEQSIIGALKSIILEHHMMVEGSAGLALAALVKEKEKYQNKTVVLILCGSKISNQILNKVLDNTED